MRLSYTRLEFELEERLLDWKWLTLLLISAQDHQLQSEMVKGRLLAIIFQRTWKSYK